MCVSAGLGGMCVLVQAWGGYVCLSAAWGGMCVLVQGLGGYVY